MGFLSGRAALSKLSAGVDGSRDRSRPSAERLRLRIVGLVQGVGFRPFVYRLARSLDLAGWIRNDADGVTLEVEGASPVLAEFFTRLESEKPPQAIFYAVDHRFLAPAGSTGFEIRESASGELPRAWILPDLATCAECRRELLSPSDRRHRYPFTNCTHCGPRFSIIESLPYDRPRTTMRTFRMCPRCEAEYRSPDDRRFHAQPNACGRCGPRVEFVGVDGEVKAMNDEGLREAEDGLRRGKILGVKGLGGYHVMTDARNEEAVARLRRRKRRPWKPFAVMYPDLESLRAHVVTPSFASPILQSAQAPILLLRRTEPGRREIAPSVAPGSPYLGVFLPSTPVHIVLLSDLGFPVVATSGNLSDEPIQYDESAIEKLRPLCDGFLRHDRPILRPVDDSVLQVITRPRVKPQVLRRARGYAPLPVVAPVDLPPLLALGGHLNAVFAMSRGKEILLSQHIGDLDVHETRVLYERTLRDFLRLYDIEPELIVHDLHPDYYTTRWAERAGLPTLGVQHHHAHLAACALENHLRGPVLGMTWDGSGYGPDGTVWGGEFLVGDARSYRRVASLRPFRLPGGERAVKEPWRVAVSLLHESFGCEFPRELPLFDAIPSRRVDLTVDMIRRGIHSPVTTSVGRLFDGVSALLGLCLESTHQAQAAQMLEYEAWKCAGAGGAVSLPFPVSEGGLPRLDWRPMVRDIVASCRRGVPPSEIAASFHTALARASARVAVATGMRQVVLAGGVFCNRYLTEALATRIESAGLRVALHSQLPPTDGSLAVGQLWIAAHVPRRGPPGAAGRHRRADFDPTGARTPTR